MNIRRSIASLVGAILPEYVKSHPTEFGLVNPQEVQVHPESLGLVTPHTLEVIAAESGMSVGQMRKTAKASARDKTRNASTLHREAERKFAEAEELTEDSLEIREALDQLDKAQGKHGKH